MDNIQISKVEKSDVKIVESINNLLGQLVSGTPSFTQDMLEEIILSEASCLYLMYKDHVVVGMFTIATYVTPSGRKYWLEDVVVDSSCRGLSLGRKLVNEAIKIVSANGKSTLMLTSKPSRIVANKLYKSSGFAQKETNVYKMDF